MELYNYKHSKADWIYEILMKEVSDEYILKGLMYWYLLKGQTIANVFDDMHFRSIQFNHVEDIKKVKEKIQKACESFVIEDCTK